MTSVRILTPRELSFSRARKLAGIIAGILALVGVTSATGPSSTDVGGTLRGQDPLASGCVADARSIWSATRSIPGHVELLYSPSCRTKWVRLSSLGGRPDHATIRIPGGQSASATRTPGSSGDLWTAMVFSPGEIPYSVAVSATFHNDTLLNKQWSFVTCVGAPTC